MKTKIIFLLIISTILSSSCLFGQNTVSKGEYLSEIRKERASKDREFLTAESSPIETGKKSAFRGLNYFKPNPAYRVVAELEVFSNPDTIKMKTTTDRLPLYLVYGKVDFTLNGKRHSLTVYQNIALMIKPGYTNYLFLPFKDLTSGEASYGGGRYVDLQTDGGKTIIIDFNRAYNPYCVYNKKYSCPIPPDGNFLETEVKAGEKDFHN